MKGNRNRAERDRLERSDSRVAGSPEGEIKPEHGESGCLKLTYLKLKTPPTKPERAWHRHPADDPPDNIGRMPMPLRTLKTYKLKTPPTKPESGKGKVACSFLTARLNTEH